MGLLTSSGSDFEHEAEEMLKSNPPVTLTPDLWVSFFLLHGISVADE